MGSRPPVRGVAGRSGACIASLGLLALLGCATQMEIPRFLAGEPHGFWHGFFHGLVAPFALVGSLFGEVRIYSFPNSGFPYDLGYLLGIAQWTVALFLLFHFGAWREARKE